MQLCEGQKHLEEQLEVSAICLYPSKGLMASQMVQGLGGEGLMLRKPQSLYVGSRSTTLLKVKTFCDEEAKVIGYEAGMMHRAAPKATNIFYIGKGKYKGQTGALMCELANGTKFCVGSGYVLAIELYSANWAQNVRCR